MKILAAVILELALLAGCAHRPTTISDPTASLTAPILRAELAIKAGDTSKALSSLKDAEKAATDEGTQSVKTQAALAKDESFIQQHNNDLLGARTKRAAKLLAWIIIPLATVIGGALIYSGNTTAIAAVAHVALTALSGGLHAVVLAVVWIVKKLRGK